MENKILELCEDILRNKNENKSCYEICNKYNNKICCSDCPLQPTPSCDYLTGQHIMLAKQYIKDHTPQELKFNWEDFKEGKIAIHTPTLESFANFNKICRKILDDGLPTEFWNVYEKTTCVDFVKISNELEYGDMKWYEEKGFSIVTFEDFISKEKNNMNTEKTFREVIADIKEGEVWENEYFRVYVQNKEINIDKKMNTTMGCGIILKGKFKLIRKEYTFEEAYKKAKEGVEIESLESGIKYKKYDENTMMFKDKDMDDFAGISNDNALFSIDEINGKWYINN